MSTLVFEALGDAPASVVRSLEDATVEKLVAVVKRADIAGKRSWMLQAIAVGVVQERSRYGEAGVRTASESLGINKKSGERFARVFRDIIRPRVDRMGDRARFPLAASSWYLAACSAAAAGGPPALELA